MVCSLITRAPAWLVRIAASSAARARMRALLIAQAAGGALPIAMTESVIARAIAARGLASAKPLLWTHLCTTSCAKDPTFGTGMDATGAIAGANGWAEAGHCVNRHTRVGESQPEISPPSLF